MGARHSRRVNLVVETNGDNIHIDDSPIILPKNNPNTDFEKAVVANNLELVEEMLYSGKAKCKTNPVILANEYELTEMEDYLRENYINSDELLENGYWGVVAQAIQEKKPIYSSNPKLINTAAKHKQFMFVNWLWKNGYAEIEIHRL